MSESHKKIEAFLHELRSALNMSVGQKEDVVDEVRMDLLAHLDRYRAEGLDDRQAVQRAIEEMGNPYELAHHMRHEVPPFGPDWATRLRYGVATVIAGWTLFLLWMLRAGVYGFDPILGLIVLIHFPVALLVWPRIVWRRNLLYRANLGAMGLLVVMLLAGAGTTQSTDAVLISQAIHEDTGSLVPEPSPASEDRRRRILGFITLGLAIGATGLVLSVQRRSQRRIIVAGLAIGIAGVEIPYQFEEWMFRKDHDAVLDYVQAVQRETGAIPSKEEYAAARSSLQLPELRFRPSDGHYSIFWSRPLSRGHSILYSSKSGHTSVQD